MSACMYLSHPGPLLHERSMTVCIMGPNCPLSSPLSPEEGRKLTWLRGSTQEARARLVPSASQGGEDPLSGPTQQ